jgi:hypothetical protein
MNADILNDIFAHVNDNNRRLNSLADVIEGPQPTQQTDLITAPENLIQIVSAIKESLVEQSVLISRAERNLFSTTPQTLGVATRG